MPEIPFLTLQNLLIWVGAWTVLGVAVMGEDKDQAVMAGERIGERTLHEIALAGGFLGIIVGARLFHHKVSKPEFWPPVAAAIVLWGLLLYLLGTLGLIAFAL